jgi:hypothetical protein
MAQLLGALQSLGIQAPQNAQAQAGAQAASGAEGLQQALGAATPSQTPGGEGSGAGGDQAMVGATPPVTGASSDAQGHVSPPSNAPVLQGMVQGGEAKGRIMTQQKLGRR